MYKRQEGYSMNRRIAIGFILALMVGLGLLSIAAAHADLERSEPAADAVLSESPKEVRMFFTQSLKPETTARVLDANGTQVDNKDGKIDLNDLDHKTFVLTLPTLAPGTYTVEWNTVSDEDGESDEGSFKFTVGTAQAQPTAAPTTAAQATAAPTTAAQPTVAPASTTAPAATPRPTSAPAGGSPQTLPQTSEGGAQPYAYLLLAAVLAVSSGLLLCRVLARARG
jgi:methionine-rich copper-binding protein CopC